MIIKKITNWTFGAFFRTLGRTLAVLLLGALLALFCIKKHIKIGKLIGIEYIHAATVSIDNYETIPNGTYYDCTSSGCSSVSTTTDVYQTLNNEYNMQVNSSTMTIASNGVAFTYQPYETFKSGYLYNVTTYFCSNKNLSSTSKNQFLGSATSSVSTNYTTTSSSTMNTIGTFNYCYEIQSLISPKSNTNQVTYKLTSSSSISGVYLYSIGFKIKDLGLYTSEVQSIVQSAIQSSTSGLATSTQLEEATTQIEQAESQTTDAVNNQLGNKCENLINFNDGNTYSITATRDDYYVSTNYKVNLTAGKTYYIKYKSNKPGGNVSGTDTSQLWFLLNNEYNTLYSIYNKDTTLTPTISGNYYIRVDCNKNGSTCTYYDLMISEVNKPYCKYGSYTSKLDDTNNAINNLNDNINSDDSSGAQSEASDFFNNFNDNGHGLTSIITAPLNSIQLMLSDSCVAPHTVYKGASISLPCGSILWSRPGADSLKNFLNLVYGGLLAYYFITNLLSWVNDFKNPDNDKIEVTDL